MTKRRRRFRQTVPLEQRLELEAENLRAEAEALSPSLEREAMLKRARQIEVAAHITEWLTSPGLRSPT